MNLPKPLSSVIQSNFVGADVMLEGLTLDSRDVKKGFLFCALKGERVDGHQYIAKAIDKGAIAIAVESDTYIQNKVTTVVDPALRQKLGVIASKFFDCPSASIRVIAITGTNGKTSTCEYIRQLLGFMGSACATIGTLGVQSQNERVPLINTTPDVISLNRMLKELVRAKQESVAMEVSSHALIQNRVEGIHFDTAIFTNISQDHLDYHGDMAHYTEAKSRLFSYEGLRCGIINIDDPQAQQMLASMGQEVKVIRYSLRNDEADVYLEAINESQSGYQATLCYQNEKLDFNTALIGEFNLYNLIASIIAVREQGFALKSVVANTGKVSSAEGRMHQIDNLLGVTAIVDFAHTPDALENILLAVAGINYNNLYVVFGCGGDRDKGKRPLMGAVVEKYADFCWVTSDNPRSEPQSDICSDITCGMKKQNHRVILDRKDAIYAAVDVLKEGDCLIIAGKGHEKYQQIGDDYIPFDDVEILRLALNEKEVTG